MGIFVAKFGGTSLADAAQFVKVKQIITSDQRRRFVVPSAPGKRTKEDIKVTDMLYECHKLAQNGQDFSHIFANLCDRYREIIASLGIALSLEDAFETIRKHIPTQKTADYIASRGEYLNGLIVAAYLDLPFVDAAQVIFFDDKGRFDAAMTQNIASEKLRVMEGAVIPGFYGSMPDGSIKTFSRGGSDISGAIIARAVAAEVYENWTDVSGFLMADPRIVDHPQVIDQITYRELRELSYMGATVLHEDSIFPVRQAGIPINVRNTNDPDAPGTYIVQHTSGDSLKRHGRITGVAGRKGYLVITLEKGLMNNETGFGRRVLSVIERHGLSFEHMPTGIDTLSLVISEGQFDSISLDAVLSELQLDCAPERLEVERGLALIATVGEGMATATGTAGKLFSAMAKNEINIRMIAQGSSEINIIIGVSNEDFEKSIRSIYQGFTE